MGHVLCARTELKHRKKLGARIDGQPQPEHLCGAAQPRAEFVQLEVRDLQVAEATLMEVLSVASCASEPRRDGGLTITEDPFGGGWVQTFGQRREHHGDLLGGGFQMVQRSIVSSAERGAASLTKERLDRFSAAMFAISDSTLSTSHE
jgi:hypothetical protein